MYIMNKIITKQKYKSELKEQEEYVLSEIQGFLYQVFIGQKIRIIEGNLGLWAQVVSIQDIVPCSGNYIQRNIEVIIQKQEE